ncbi:hypothetical protein ACFO5O_00270 [Geojedonia litorea]|uniref:DUF4198 domain-containing protein n=1 Tax=Geojedonia litorea TaxID=1268269 RepID=A0ABV9MXK3_9FLAO
MKTSLISKPSKFLTIVFSCLTLAVVFQSCKSDKKEAKSEEVEKENVVDILTENMDFQMPDTIPSGWTTFRYKNASPQTHFVLIDKYPEGKTLDTVMAVVVPVFDEGMKLINEGKAEEGYAAFGKLPTWFGELKFIGGTGLISPERVAQTTMKLEPGNYILECYVKMSNGVFHTSMGMAKEVVVTNEDSGNSEPKADYAIEISSTDGIVLNETPSGGTHTFSVFFKDQIVHEHFLGHDVNLAKLDETANLDELNNWMNWADPKGLIEPAPQGITFLGGVNNMLEGDTGYFNATLVPGKYAFIAEVPNAVGKNMLKVFEVTSPQ